MLSAHVGGCIVRPSSWTEVGPHAFEPQRISMKSVSHTEVGLSIGPVGAEKFEAVTRLEKLI